MKSFLLLLLAFSFVTCNSKNGSGKDPVIVKLPPITHAVTTKDSATVSDFNYDLKNPNHTWKLPSALIEVSGNTWVDKDHIILIEDLHPNLYLIKTDEKSATLEKTIPFQKDEKDKFDIEDVTIVNNVVYALWSHGILFQIDNWNSKPEVKEIETSLSKRNNTEGLCYDPVSQTLLIACKNKSGLEDEKKSTKAVYQFDMKTNKIEEKPFLIIQKGDFKKLAKEKISFNPSAIAIHPVTHNIYLLSTRDNKCMAVYNREGNLISFQFIDPNMMQQPEGICFSPDGKLYISSEGKKGEPGNLFQFDPK